MERMGCVDPEMAKVETVGVDTAKVVELDRLVSPLQREGAQNKNAPKRDAMRDRTSRWVSCP